MHSFNLAPSDRAVTDWLEWIGMIIEHLNKLNFSRWVCLFLLLSRLDLLSFYFFDFQSIESKQINVRYSRKIVIFNLCSKWTSRHAQCALHTTICCLFHCIFLGFQKFFIWNSWWNFWKIKETQKISEENDKKMETTLFDVIECYVTIQLESINWKGHTTTE